MRQGLIVDCYADGQFKVKVDFDESGQSKVVFGIGDKYTKKEVLEGKIEDPHQALDLNQVIENLEKAKNPNQLIKSFGFIQSYIMNHMNNDMQTDFIKYNSHLKKMCKIFNLLFEISLIILKQKDLVFVDHDQSELNQCVIWPELFYFLHSLFRETHEAQDFFERYEHLITDELLKKPQEKFFIGLNLRQTIGHLFDSKHSMKFINQLTDLLRFSSLSALELLNCDLETKVKEDPFRKMLVLLKNYYCEANKNSFGNYCSATTREFFLRLIEIIKDYSQDLDADKKMSQIIEKKLISFSLRAFKRTDKLSRKISLARDIGICYKNIRQRAEVFETLVKKKYLSSISVHNELISFSESFIADIFTNKKENDSNFIQIFKVLETNCMQEIVNIQMSLSNLSIDTVNAQISAVVSKYTQIMQPVLLKLYLVKLLSSKDLEQFLRDLNSIQHLTRALILDHLLSPILAHHELVKLFLINPYSGLDSFGFFISCQLLESLTVEKLLNFDREFKYFDSIFNKHAQASNQQQVFLHILLKKYSSPIKHRFGEFIKLINNDDSWIDTFCKWINEGLADEAMENCLNEFFLKDYVAQDLSLYVSAFDRMVEGYYLKKKHRITVNMIRKLIEVFFEYDQVSSDVSEKMGTTIMKVIKEQNVLNHKEISELFEENLESIEKVERILEFLKVAVNEKYIDNENFLRKLFEKVNHDNFEIVSKFLLNSGSIIKEFYNPNSSNEYQDYLVLHITSSDDQNLHIYLETTLKKNITFAKLAQVILTYPSNIPIIERHQSNLCSVILSSPCSHLDATFNIQKQMPLFIKSAQNLNIIHIVSRVIEPFNKGVYSPLVLLKKSLKRMKLSDVLTEFSKQQEKFLNSPNLKQISTILDQKYQEADALTMNSFIENLYALVKRDPDQFENPNLLFSNLLKFMFGLVKHCLGLQIFSVILNDLRTWFACEDYYYPQSIKVRSRAYKLAFELKDQGFIDNIIKQGHDFFETNKGIRPSKLQKYSQSLANGSKGLKNSGMICYMNAALILLSSHDEFIQKLISLYSQDKPLLTSVLYIFGKLQYSYLNCTNAVKLLKKYPLFEINEMIQRDSCEFLAELLNYLSMENGEDINSPLEINISSNIRCDYCGTVKILTAKEFMVYIECIQPESVAKKLLDYEDIQRLELDNKYDCENCNCKQNATITKKIENLPSTFVVQIKRFSYEVQSRRQIKLNTQMKLENQVQVRTESQGLIQYYLKGILVHTGSADAGHYFYYKRLNENDWVFINDQKSQILKNFNPESIESHHTGYPTQSTNPYILLYSTNLDQSQLVLPNDIKLKIDSKNLKYLKLTRFLRSDIFDIIGQMARVQINPDITMYYFFNYLSNIWQTNEEFIKKSKKLLKIFKKIEDFQRYLDFIETILPTILEWCNMIEPYSYIKIELIKTLMIRGSYEQRLRFYSLLSTAVTSNQNPINITLVFNLFIETGFSVFNSIDEQLFKYILNSYESFSFKMQMGLSQIFNFIAAKTQDVNIYYKALYYKLEFLIVNLPPSSFEPLSKLIAGFSTDLRNELINTIAKMNDPKKFSIMILIFCQIAAKDKESIIEFYGFIKWIFESTNSSELPRLIKLAYNCFKEDEFKYLVDNFLKPALVSEELHLAIIKDELNQIYLDILSGKKIDIELQGENVDEVFRDPYTRQRFDIVDKVNDYLLIRNQNSGKTELRLLFND